MNYIYYSIIILYPVIAAVISTLTLGSDLFDSIKKAFYLWFATIILYGGCMLLFLSFVHIIFGFWVNFGAFTISFFLVFFIRAYIQTETHDIMAALPGEKKD